MTVDVTGTASDESGGSGIQKVEVKVGSNPFKLATATGPGGSADWSTWSASDVVTSAGSTTILARATDNAGNTKDDTITCNCRLYWLRYVYYHIFSGWH